MHLSGLHALPEEFARLVVKPVEPPSRSHGKAAAESLPQRPGTAPSGLDCARRRRCGGRGRGRGRRRRGHAWLLAAASGVYEALLAVLVDWRRPPEQVPLLFFHSTHSVESRAALAPVPGRNQIANKVCSVPSVG